MEKKNRKMTSNESLSELEALLARRYLELRDLKAMTKTIVDEDMKKTYVFNRAKHFVLSERVPLDLRKVDVKPSKIHGRGVFAAQKISVGELITFYPAHIIDYTPNADRAIDNHTCITCGSSSFSLRFGDSNIRDPCFRDNDYAFSIDELYTIIGVKQIDDDLTYVGHLINDGVKCDNTPQSHSVYWRVVPMKDNCMFKTLKHGLHVAVLATRDIAEGEELLVPYGHAFWSSYHERHHGRRLISKSGSPLKGETNCNRNG